MENSGEINIPITSKTKRSPQEIAASVLEVYSTGLEHSGHPDGKELDKKFNESKEKITQLLGNRVDDETLGLELNKIYEEGKKLGIYNPLKSDDRDQFLAKNKDFYSSIGYSQEESEKKAAERVSKYGFWGKFKEWRQNHEKDINTKFSSFLESHQMSENEEAIKISELEKKCIRLENPDQIPELSSSFSGGNYLFHGTKVEQAIEILNSGNLANYKSLLDQEEERFIKEGGEKKFGHKNSGYEGISWSFNQIEALPGDRYHLVGFLTSPNIALKENLQLSIPSRPAPNELILINKDIDANKFYDIKTQQELLSDFYIGERNSVLSNLIQLASYKENQKSENPNSFIGESMLFNFLETDLADNEIEQLLRSKYLVRENGTIQFSPDLLQQTAKEIPVGAVWLQGLIDTGRIKNIPSFENIKTVKELISKTESYKIFLDEIKKEKFYLEDIVEEEDTKVTSINIPISELYLVIPNTDLKKWLKTIARTSVQPKGILIYNHQAVRLENFASIHHGDNNNLSQIIRNAIPKSESYLDFEKDILGEEMTEEKLAGYRHHVIGEQYLSKRRSVIKQNDDLILI